MYVQGEAMASVAVDPALPGPPPNTPLSYGMGALYCLAKIRYYV